MHGESEGKRPGAGVQGEVARLNNGVTLNPSPLMSAAAKKKKKRFPLSRDNTAGKLVSSPPPVLLPSPPCPEQTLGKRKQCQVETGDI